jgi:hypothetical protein
MVMKKTRKLHKCLVPLGILLVGTLIFSVTASAQSGRRIKTPIPAPTPVPETAPTPKADPTPDPIDARYSFKVVRSAQFTLSTRLLIPENIQSRVVERLGNSSLVRVERGGESNRKEAINLAESLAETYVVLLTISEEDSNPTRDPVTGKIGNGRVRVNFDIFAPQTGKSAGSGSTYVDFRTSGILGRTRQNRCYPNVYGEELMILQAGYEVAERIMKKFELPVSQSCR